MRISEDNQERDLQYGWDVRSSRRCLFALSANTSYLIQVDKATEYRALLLLNFISCIFIRSSVHSVIAYSVSYLL